MSANSGTSVTQVVADVTWKSGGPSYSVPSLCSALARLGSTVTLRTLGSDQSMQKSGFKLQVHAGAEGVGSRAIRRSLSLHDALLADMRRGDVIHTHGLWLMPNVYPAWVKRDSRALGRVVHSTRGMLGPEALRISAWKKQIFWRLLQRSALRAANCLHATAESEYHEIRAAGLMNPVAIVPNGIDLPALESAPDAPSGLRTVLSLGRIHPKKGLDRLILAWVNVQAEHPDWRLRIVGPAEVGHDKELNQLALSLGACRLTIEAPVFGPGRLDLYRSANLFVLPTLNENFALTVAEALAAEVPVISSKGAPWSGLDRERCGWWIDHGVEALTASLRYAMALPEAELHEMGRRGRVWMGRDFCWDAVATDMLRVYSWLNHGGTVPATVRVD